MSYPERRDKHTTGKWYEETKHKKAGVRAHPGEDVYEPREEAAHQDRRADRQQRGPSARWRG